MNPWSRIDFEHLYKILRVSAEAAVRYAPQTFNMGLSAQDLAHETFSIFLNSPDALGWDPAKGPIEKFLTAVLWKKAKSHLRRHRKVAGSFDDPGRTRIPVPSVTADTANIQFKEFVEKVYEAIGDDQDLRDLIAAAEHTSGAGNVNQQLAEILGKTVPQIVNLKRRLLNNQRVINYLWPERNQ